MIFCPWQSAPGFCVTMLQVHLLHCALVTGEGAGENPGGETLQSGRRDRLPHQHPGRPGEQPPLQAPHHAGTQPHVVPRIM